MNEIGITTEEWRSYVYPDGANYKIIRPIKLFYKSDERGDSHRVVDGSGVTHYPKRGWIAIQWYAPTEQVSF